MRPSIIRILFTIGSGFKSINTPDRRQVVQLRSQGYSFNRLAPYGTLDDYLNEIRRTWLIYVGLARPIAVKKIQLRYINRILLPMSHHQVDLDLYLRLGPRIADDDNVLVRSFLNQYTAVEKTTGLLVNVTITLQPEENEKFPIIFDNIVISPGPDSDPGDWDGLKKRIEALRILKNRVFESTLTEACLKLFQAVSTVDSLGYAVLVPYTQQSSAVSPEAIAAGRIASDIVRESKRSIALFSEQTAALSNLFALARECAEDDWDAAGAQAIDCIAVERAAQLLKALPNSIPMPECSPEPDGSISLDWSESRYRLFSISVGGSDRLAFAWLDGSNKGHGVARFDGRVVPKHVLAGIRSTLDQTHAAVRAA